jgi:cytochrome c biogenesis protein CcmG/thiol:disulfide interchange protein DsbE
MSRRSFLVLLVVGALVLVAGLSAYLLRSDGQEIGVNEASGPMPEVAGETLDGGRFGPSDYDGKVVVVNFWAAWCAPCRVEQPILQSMHEEWSDEGVVFVGVDYRDDPAAARAHLREFGTTYPSIEDADGNLAGARFGLAGVPATVVADQTGEMRYLFLGAVEEDELRAALEELTAPS